MNYYYTVTNEVTPSYFNAYLDIQEDFYIDGSIIDGLNITVATTQELTPTEESGLYTYVMAYTDFNQTLLDDETLQICKAWGRTMMNQFELKNMNRKRLETLSRIGLSNIMVEIHDSFVFICMLEGSLDTLHGILYGFPSTDTEDAVAPYTFAHTWAEDIEWLKTELNILLAGL